ncbi:MAG: PEP-CTERM sorting domain-containing protein [Gammaproteobacteria bacterium]
MKSLNAIQSVIAALVIGAASLPAAAAPVLYVNDVNGSLGTVDVATAHVSIIGNTGQWLTDIAFDPNGNLYGITFNQLFSLNKQTGAATLVGNLNTSLNSLVFGSDGTLYGANQALYTINTTTGAASLVGSGGAAYSSSGDLAFAGGALYLTSGPGDRLIKLDTATGAGTDVGAVGYSQVYGLASDDGQHLYGVAGTQVLEINPQTGAGVVVADYASQGLWSANGSAFLSEAVTPPVPEPTTGLMLGVGAACLYLVRRRQSGKSA